MTHNVTAREKKLNDRIGKNIIHYRKLMGMSQKTLAEEISITYQQLHKYETGVNRTSAAKLDTIAIKLEVPLKDLLCSEGGEPKDPENSTIILRLVRGARKLPKETVKLLADLADAYGKADK